MNLAPEVALKICCHLMNMKSEDLNWFKDHYCGVEYLQHAIEVAPKYIKDGHPAQLQTFLELFFQPEYDCDHDCPEGQIPCLGDPYRGIVTKMWQLWHTGNEW